MGGIDNASFSCYSVYVYIDRIGVSPWVRIWSILSQRGRAYIGNFLMLVTCGVAPLRHVFGDAANRAVLAPILITPDTAPNIC